MLSVEERVEALRTRGKNCKNHREFAALLASDKSLKAEIIDLYRKLLGKQLTGCSNCVIDAFMEIINFKNIKEMEETKEKGWKVRAGTLLHDVNNFDSSLQLSTKKITEELCIYHLATNPSCKKYFEEMPDDWEAKVKEFREKNGQAVEGDVQGAAEKNKLADTIAAAKKKEQELKKAEAAKEKKEGKKQQTGAV